jgi:hypothetical protein
VTFDDVPRRCEPKHAYTRKQSANDRRKASTRAAKRRQFTVGSSDRELIAKRVASRWSEKVKGGRRVMNQQVCCAPGTVKTRGCCDETVTQQRARSGFPCDILEGINSRIHRQPARRCSRPVSSRGCDGHVLLHVGILVLVQRCHDGAQFVQRGDRCDGVELALQSGCDALHTSWTDAV